MKSAERTQRLEYLKQLVDEGLQVSVGYVVAKEILNVYIENKFDFLIARIKSPEYRTIQEYIEQSKHKNYGD